MLSARSFTISASISQTSCSMAKLTPLADLPEGSTLPGEVVNLIAKQTLLPEWNPDVVSDEIQATRLDFSLINVSKSTRAATLKALAEDTVFVRLTYSNCEYCPPCRDFWTKMKHSDPFRNKLGSFFPDILPTGFPIGELQAANGLLMSTIDIDVSPHSGCAKTNCVDSKGFQVSKLNVLAMCHTIQAHLDYYTDIDIFCMPVAKKTVEPMKNTLLDMAHLVRGTNQCTVKLHGLPDAHSLSDTLNTALISTNYQLAFEERLCVWEHQLQHIKDILADGIPTHQIFPLIQSLTSKEENDLFMRSFLVDESFPGAIPRATPEESTRFTRIRLQFYTLYFNGLAEYFLRKPNTRPTQRHPLLAYSQGEYDWEWDTKSGLKQAITHASREDADSEIKALACAALTARAQLYVAVARRAAIPHTLSRTFTLPCMLRDEIWRGPRWMIGPYIGNIYMFLDNEPGSYITEARDDLEWVYEHAKLIQDANARSVVMGSSMRFIRWGLWSMRR
ncbi:hypothetical protein OHC33_000182 [Knufia fluminis]|uniref:Uncharacterized protein n=1 Tax=Knufia fluminis TaxID=191047 RepID=A0AAN8ICB3_9EURO|nr:hypothetical protein OHC33_000182 [Knufia fluminis]